MLPGYYGMRRPFISESEFCHPAKQFPPEVYNSSLGGKALPTDPSSMAGYSSLIDSYYPESFGDYRNTAFPSGGTSIFPPSALSSLLPPFSGDSHFILIRPFTIAPCQSLCHNLTIATPSPLHAHPAASTTLLCTPRTATPRRSPTAKPPSHISILSLSLQRDTWDQPAADSVSPGEGLCADSLANVQTPASDSGSPSPYRGSIRGSGPSSAQNYAFHPLDEVHYSTPYPSAAGYACSPYMTVPSELASKMQTLSGEESDSAPPTLSDPTPWQKDDGTSTWSPYEIRRAY
ncbi:hypothetical protein SKAU_G00082590 [Synaphobranchus kaupii]|uniref:Uncharacterized protein n=1 Tax=Synaphobranchus kaupii TaxID=118154 RepID=A0A9Q1FV44_SYNKA|nr:hypothetical protein SKAU_G00082590 [Synaphobranchus kaupii]